MTDEQKGDINELHCKCMRLAKAMIDALRTLSSKLNALVDEQPELEEPEEFGKFIKKQFGISPMLADTLLDVYFIPEIQGAKCSAADAMSLLEATELLRMVIAPVVEDDYETDEEDE